MKHTTLISSGVLAGLLFAGLFGGCASGDDVGDGTKPDAAADAEAPDGSTDAPTEASGPDTGVDAGEDTQPDAIEPDAADAGTDAVTDALADAGCGVGTKACNGQCVSEQDPANGCAGPSCDPCQTANATAVCVNGNCAIQSCSLGYADCNGQSWDGCEIDLLATPSNCGSCGNTCVLPNATHKCENGACVIASCNTGFANCDPSTTNGCETNTLLDPSHCGGCAKLCQPVGSSACANGVCQTTGCPTGKGNCDGVPDNGCETDLTSTTQHCGFCSNACSLLNATPKCAQSKCEIASCNSGYADCDLYHPNGCEIDLSTSTTHCGTCGGGCSTTNNTGRTCAIGLCSYTCNSGFADCNGPQPGASDDGCETNTANDVNNCGGCSTQCANAHGFTACSNAKCAPTCTGGYGDCNGNLNDGCETAVSTISNCGGCGVTCTNAHGTTGCNGTSCTPTCDPGWVDCNGNPNDGCETAANTVSNCGGCGVVCTNAHGTTGCNGTSCTPTCELGWANCSNPNDGCETNTAIDPLNCGVCGKSCTAANAQTTCTGGACAIVSCSAQHYDINKNPADGCEYKCPFVTPGPETCDGADNDCDQAVDEDFDLTQDPNNCGSCGTSCGTATGGLCCASTCKMSDPNNCGACGQTCTSGMLIINELMIDPDKVTDTQGEWFELYNPSAFAVDLRGFVIKDLGTDTHTISSATPVLVPAGGFIVLGNNANLSTNGGVTEAYQYGTFFMGNSGDELLVIAHGVELDRVVWTGTFDVIGKSKELSKNHQNINQNDTLTNWCAALKALPMGDFGTPGTANDCAL